MGYIGAIALLDRIHCCNAADLGAFVPWYASGLVVGHVHHERVPMLLDGDAVFGLEAGLLTLRGADFGSRSVAIAHVVDRLVAAGELRPVLGEYYPVAAGCAPVPLLQIDRTAVAWFGVRAAGVHLNGYVRRADGLHLWVAERSRRKRSYPGHLDNLVAGGSAIGMSARETLVKECHEEAGIAPLLAEAAIPVGALRYVMQDGHSLKPDVLACFDLELPADFVPQALDGEVESFRLWPIDEVVESVRGSGLWKPNCALVVIDFLLRHGALDATVSAADRWDLWQRLRR